MNNKVLKLIIFLIIVCIGFKIDFIVNGAEKTLNISLNANSENVADNEEFEITVNANNFEIAACTLFIYYESEKVECVTNNDNINNINVLENRIIYSWYSSNRKKCNNK